MRKISQDRIERVAKWAGFEYAEHGDNDFWIFKPHPTYENLGVYGSRWITPLGTAAWAELPDFPNDIEACFAYFTPLLRRCNMTLEEGVFFIFEAGHPKYGNPVTGPAEENPARAFFLAVEKLITEEELHGNNNR